MSVNQVDLLFDFFHHLTGLERSEYEQFIEITQKVDIAKGELFLSPDDGPNKMGIVLTGCLKSYFLTFEGAHHNRAFLASHDITAALGSVELEYAPDLFVEAITDSSLLRFFYKDLQDLASKSQPIQNLAYKLLELEFIKNEKKEYHFSTKSLDENFKIINSELDKRGLVIKQKDIANYLGITDIAYSRIKKRLSGLN